MGSIRDNSTRSQFSQLSVDSMAEGVNQRIAKLEMLLREETEKVRESQMRAAACEEETRKARARTAELEAQNRELEAQNRELVRRLAAHDQQKAVVGPTGGQQDASDQRSFSGSQLHSMQRAGTGGGGMFRVAGAAAHPAAEPPRAPGTAPSWATPALADPRAPAGAITAPGATGVGPAPARRHPRSGS